MIPSTWLRPVAFHNELDRFLHDFWSQSSPRGFAHTAGHAPALNYPLNSKPSGFQQVVMNPFQFSFLSALRRSLSLF
jgi:hypothetical protein